jgi:hypothetical protein
VNGFRPYGIEWEFEPYITIARAVIGDQEFEAARAEGRAMTRDQAVKFALEDGH